jgi:hypothetical protein
MESISGGLSLGRSEKSAIICSKETQPVREVSSVICTGFVGNAETRTPTACTLPPRRYYAAALDDPSRLQWAEPKFRATLRYQIQSGNTARINNG